MANKTKFSEALEQVQQNKINTPLQKVVPIVEKEEEVGLTIFVPVQIKEFLKIQVVKEKTTIKDLITNLIKDKYNLREQE